MLDGLKATWRRLCSRLSRKPQTVTLRLICRDMAPVVYLPDGTGVHPALAKVQGYVIGISRCTRRTCLASHKSAVPADEVHAFGECSKCGHLSCEFTPHE